MADRSKHLAGYTARAKKQTIQSVLLHPDSEPLVRVDTKPQNIFYYNTVNGYHFTLNTLASPGAATKPLKPTTLRSLKLIALRTS